MEYLDYVVTSRELTAFADREGSITEENIYNERRKEFYADGESFFDMKHLQSDVDFRAWRLLRHGRRHLYDSHSEKRGGQLPKLNDEAL